LSLLTSCKLKQLGFGKDMPADQRAKYEENELKNLKKNAPKPPK